MSPTPHLQAPSALPTPALFAASAPSSNVSGSADPASHLISLAPNARPKAPRVSAEPISSSPVDAVTQVDAVAEEQYRQAARILVRGLLQSLPNATPASESGSASG